MHAFMHICTHVYMHTHACICIYACTHICAHIYTCMYVCIPVLRIRELTGWVLIASIPESLPTRTGINCGKAEASGPSNLSHSTFRAQCTAPAQTMTPMTHALTECCLSRSPPTPHLWHLFQARLLPLPITGSSQMCGCPCSVTWKFPYWVFFFFSFCIA